MGSSHSYLQNLEATVDKTMMYTVKDDACFQYEVSDLYTSIAMTEGSVSGTCAINAGFVVKGKSFKHDGEYKGHAYTTMVTEYNHAGLQELCDGSDCNQMFLQNLCDGGDCNQQPFLQELATVVTATNNSHSSKNFAMEAIATKCHTSCKNFTNLKTLPTGSSEINAIKKLSQLTSWLRSSRLQSTDSPVDASLVDTPKLADPSPPPLPLSVMLFLMNSPCQP